MVLGTKVPGNEWSRERMFQELMVPVMKVPGNERSREQMFQGTNGPENESSIMGTNVPGTNCLENEYS